MYCAAAEPAIRVLSCHDSTLIGVLQGLGLRSGDSEGWPGYASVLELELLHDDDPSPSTRPGTYESGYPRAFDSWYLRARMSGRPLRWPEGTVEGPEGAAMLSDVLALNSIYLGSPDEFWGVWR